MNRYAMSFASLLLLLAIGAASAAEPAFKWKALSPPPAAAPAAASRDLASPKIVGGTAAANGAWPMMVFLTLYTSPSIAFVCGGTVVAPFVVMTAAHCVANDSGQGEVTAVTATVASNDSLSSQTVQAASVIWHSSFRGPTKGNDIALIRLAEPLTVASVSLSTPAEDAALTPGGAVSTGLGWGVTSEVDSDPERFLRQVDMPIVANATCAVQVRQSIAAGQICAGEAAGGKDTCQGDSGGPLFVKDSTGAYRQVGITSYGNGCARPNDPGVYTRVASFSSWIQDSIAAFAIPIQYTGWWWNDAEPGTGFSVEKRGDNFFVAVFAYRNDGSPAWYVATGPITGDGRFVAPLVEHAGGQTLSGGWRAETPVGTAANLSIVFTSPTRATITIGSRTIAAQRFPFADSYAIRQPATGLPQAGWWWNAAEPGRGFYLDFQKSVLFFAAYMYDSSGAATWYLSTGSMVSTLLYSGTLQQYGGGETLAGAWQPASVTGTAGSFSILFSSGTAATLFLPTGATVPLTRFEF